MKATKIEMQVYETPSVEIMEVMVEQGFAQSQSQIEQLNRKTEEVEW